MKYLPYYGGALIGCSIVGVITGRIDGPVIAAILFTGVFLSVNSWAEEKKR